jgi:glutamine amidotransferase
MPATVAVIDYGMGNLHSVAKALEHVAGDTRVLVTDSAEQIELADRVILPGVGALRDCMSALQERGLLPVIQHCASSRPFLGICLGLQALLDHSEENAGTPGFGLIAGEVRRFAGPSFAGHDALKIPHMGWNEVKQSDPAHPMWRSIPNCARFYFVHSYYVAPQDSSVVAGCTEYGHSFASALAVGNIFAVQFHPEKSQHAGLQLLANFLAWQGAR